MKEPELSIVVLQWNHSDLTHSCVESIRSHTDARYELIIVDNGSGDEAKRLAEHAADVAVLLDENRGFSGGMNAGLEASSAPLIAFVNNDTTVPAGWASKLIEDVKDDRVGIVAPVVSSAGNVSSVRAGAGTSVIVARPFVDLPSGVVYVMRSHVIRELGGWSSDYEQASAEDLDLLFAVWSIGLDVVIDERVFIEHVGSATASDLDGKGRIWSANRRLFAQTWSDMDEATFRRRYAWEEAVSATRLEEARIAAHWMGRLFSARDEAGALRTGNARPQPSMSGSRMRRWWRRTTEID